MPNPSLIVIIFLIITEPTVGKKLNPVTRKIKRKKTSNSYNRYLFTLLNFVIYSNLFYIYSYVILKASEIVPTF